LINAPVDIEEKYIDINQLIGKANTEYIMVPCSCTSIRKKSVLFLDRCPRISKKIENDLTLIGCNRSMKIFKSVYGFVPKNISMCPLEILRIRKLTGPILTRCCELKQKLKIKGDLAIVPWDANLTQVSKALNMLVKK
jgi:hypothetical protein